MDWSQIEPRWSEIAEHARRRWSLLSDEDLRDVGGRRRKLIGRIQRRYTLPFRQAKAEVAAWTAALPA